MFALILLQIAFTSIVAQEEGSHLIPLHFLNILPFPDSRPTSGWDRGYELKPAAQLAADHINNDSRLLSDYKLNIVTVPSEPCGISLISDGIANSYAEVFDEGQALNVVGIGGLFCSTVTNALTGIFSSPNVKFLQLAGSTTPVHRDSTLYPWLVHFVSSSSVFNDAVLAMMRTFKWRRISIIYRSLGFFFPTDAVDFIKRAKKSGFDVVSTLSPADHQDTSEIFKILREVQARIIYITAPNSRCAIVMCEAYKNRAIYPGYVYIFQDKSVAEIVQAGENSTSCTAEQLMEAMEGVFFINYNLVANPDAKLISNITYSEYYQEYVSRVENVDSTITNIDLNRDNDYANVMYDQVWALALALNSSLEKISSQNITLRDWQLLDSPFIAETLKNEIKTVSFQGASGLISFNLEHEKESLVKVFQVINGTEELIAEYQSERDENECLGSERDENECLGSGVNLTTTLCLLKCITPPSDKFPTTVQLLPLWVSTLVDFIIGVVMVETTITFIILYVMNKKRPEVKASSVSLSVVMYVGCYCTYVAALMKNISRSYNISNSGVFTMVCNFEVWFGTIGMTLVFSPLLLRLLRVRRIFKAYGRVSKIWESKYLILCVLLITLGNVLILLVWTVADTYRKFTSSTFESTAILPHYESLSVCYSDYWGTWVLLVFSYNGIIMALVVVTAVQTRKIRLSNFKDTKKINIFIVTTCTTLLTLFPLWFVVDMTLQQFIGGHFIISFAIICTGVYCQLFLFLPLVVKITRKKTINRRLTAQPSSSSSLIQQYQSKERQFSIIFKPQQP